MKQRGTVMLHVPVSLRFRAELRERSHKTKTPMGRIIETLVQKAWNEPAPPSPQCALKLCPLEEGR